MKMAEDMQQDPNNWQRVIKYDLRGKYEFVAIKEGKLFMKVATSI